LRNNVCFIALLTLFCALFLWLGTDRAQAIPLFAQRYQLQCNACHTVLPELNAFGQSFRAHGYQLPLPKHGTTGIAVRYQLEYERDPAAGNRRFSPGGVLLTNWDIGKVSAFIHYNLGAGGGPSAVFLGYLATYNAHTKSLYRAGLFELPLAQSPGQRLDDLQQYGYYGTHVGLNDLALASPRWGAQVERTTGATILDFTVSTGEFKGAAYGGKPIATGETTSASSPEIGLFARAPLIAGVDVGAQVLTGSRHIVPTGGAGFDDTYHRGGFLLHAAVRKFDVQAEQWWGEDFNADGFGTLIGSSGGYARVKYYPTPHSYLGIRYDAGANPFLSRDFVYYFAFHITPHVRFLVQQVQNVGGPGHFGAALTVGAPWPPKL
jgi:hypothetical protein